jgi:hypothetical protein
MRLYLNKLAKFKIYYFAETPKLKIIENLKEQQFLNPFSKACPS